MNFAEIQTNNLKKEDIIREFFKTIDGYSQKVEKVWLTIHMDLHVNGDTSDFIITLNQNHVKKRKIWELTERGRGRVDRDELYRP